MRWLVGEAAGGDPGGDLGAGGEAELGEDVLDVVLGCAFGDVGFGGDLAVGEASGDEPGDLVLAAAQPVVVAVAAVTPGATGPVEVGQEGVGPGLHGGHAEALRRGLGLGRDRHGLLPVAGPA